LYSEVETDSTVTASHTMCVNDTVKITFDRAGYDGGCVVVSDITLSLPSSSDLLGASVNLTL
jgi:hypothetical protein